MLKYLMTLTALVLIWAPSVWAQNFQLIGVDTSEWPTVKLITALPEGDLKAESFSLKLTPDGQEIQADQLRGPINGGPVNMVVAVDTSRSLTPDNLTSAKEALGRYVDQLDSDEALALLAFNDNVQLESSFTTNRDFFKQNLEQLRLAGNKTELYRTLLYGIGLMKNLPGRHHLLVVTDGHDEGSGVTREEVLRAARLNNVRISAVGLPGLSHQDANQYLANLRGIAEQTGGVYLEASTAGELKNGMYSMLDRQRTMVRNERDRIYELVFDLDGEEIPDQGLSADLVQTTGEAQNFAGLYLQPPSEIYGDGRSASARTGLFAPSENLSTAGSLVFDTGDQTAPDYRQTLGRVQTPNTSDEPVLVVEEDEIDVPVLTQRIDTPATDRLTTAVPAGEPSKRPFWHSFWFWLVLLLLLALAYYLWQRSRRLPTAGSKSDRLVLAFPQQEYSLPRGNWQIGSGANNFIIINDDLVSPAHAEIIVTGDEWILKDLDSISGTEVNGVRIDQPVRLKTGDIIVIGRARATVR